MHKTGRDLMNKPIVALQLYTVRDVAGDDLPATLKKVKEMGYDAVELAGVYGMETDDLRRLLDENGLRAVSAHVPYQEFAADLAGTVAKYKALGCKVVGIPGLGYNSLPGGEDYPATKEMLMKIGELCYEANMPLMYHNHAHEYKELPEGDFILDRLFSDIPGGLLQTELDTGWVTAAGQCPVAYIEKYAGRCPVIHLKDTEKAGDKYEDRPTGKGAQDMPSITKAAEKAGTICFVVELDAAVGMTSLDAARESREYLKTLGY
jgi:sugar phosphate isomerase/epimerase